MWVLVSRLSLSSLDISRSTRATERSWAMYWVLSMTSRWSAWTERCGARPSWRCVSQTPHTQSLSPASSLWPGGGPTLPTPRPSPSPSCSSLSWRRPQWGHARPSTAACCRRPPPGWRWRIACSVLGAATGRRTPAGETAGNTAQQTKSDFSLTLFSPRSPLFGLDSRYRKTVVGLVSFGPSRCGSGLPGVFTKVASFTTWIENIME